MTTHHAGSGSAHDLVLRRATEEDTAVLTRIARAAKRHWGYPERWLEEWRPQLTIDAATLETHTVFVASEGKQTVGFFAVLPGDPSWSLEHLWVDPPYIGRGVGRRLFEQVMAEARRGGARALRIEADPHAAGFYERMGATRVGLVAAPVGGEARHLPVLELDMG